MDPITLKPIGIFYSQKKTPAEAARQATVDQTDADGFIQLQSKNNFQQALEGLEGFSHLWLIYQFHRNLTWKPKVMPPRGSKTKVGVFATRSPYRPNAIGISAVKIKKIEGLKIFVENHDLLDGTPILDLKPYLNYADSFPRATKGWLEGIEAEKMKITFSAKAKKSLLNLKSELPEFKNVLQTQLEYDPLNTQKKRVRKLEKNLWQFAYKTWRAQFSVSNSKIHVLEIASI